MALRILIIGHTYNQTGIGITLANLFAKVPPADVAFAAIHADFTEARTHTCFVLGRQEYQYIFPLNLFSKIPASRIVCTGTPVRKKEAKGFKWKIYQRILNPFLQRIGLYDDRIRYTLSDPLKKWIAGYDPDIIYSALGNYPACRFFAEIMKAFPEKKFAVHFMDDWVHSQPGHKLFFRKRYAAKLDAAVRQILAGCRIKITISEKMAREYERDYGCEFAWFHNPVKAGEFYRPAASGETGTTAKSLVYIGKINKDNEDGLNDCLAALERINERIACQLDLYTPTPEEYVKTKIRPSRFLRLHPALPYREIPTVLGQADLLFLPLSFRKASIRYTRLSISTKLTEYLATGRPLLVYAPDRIAMTEFVRKNKCAFTLTERNVRSLADRIAGLLDGSEAEQIRIHTETALQLIRQQFDSEIVTDRFFRLLHD